jgi:steroid delta-isomerase-like uncharacterized protein
MSTEDNKAVIRRILESSNQKDAAIFDEVISPDFVHHDPANPEVRSREDYKQWSTGFLAAFPDLHFSLEDILAEGDRVAYRWTLRATQSGSWRGAAPTGKQISFTGMSIARLRDGKIAELWLNADALGLRQQIGAIPAPGQAS